MRIALERRLDAPAAGARIDPMSPDQARPRIAELRVEVARHDELYYRQARPELTDFAYDGLKAELARLERAFPEAAATGAPSPTARVGDDRAEGFARVRHRQAMTTLDNTYDEGELRDFHARLQLLDSAREFFQIRHHVLPLPIAK